MIADIGSIHHMIGSRKTQLTSCHGQAWRTLALPTLLSSPAERRITERGRGTRSWMRPVGCTGPLPRSVLAIAAGDDCCAKLRPRDPASTPYFV